MHLLVIGNIAHAEHEGRIRYSLTRNAAAIVRRESSEYMQMSHVQTFLHSNITRCSAAEFLSNAVKNDHSLKNLIPHPVLAQALKSYRRNSGIICSASEKSAMNTTPL